MCSVVSNSLQPHELWLTRLLCPWDFPGKNTGVGCHFRLQGIFPTQGLNRHLLHWQTDSLPLCHMGSPQNMNSPILFSKFEISLISLILKSSSKVSWLLQLLKQANYILCIWHFHASSRWKEIPAMFVSLVWLYCCLGASTCLCYFDD